MEHVTNNSLKKENRASQGVGQGMLDTMFRKVTTTSPSPGGLKHLQHTEDQGYYVHLAGQLHTLLCAGVYCDTVLHCKDGSVTLKRLITGLLFPELA